MGILSLPDEVLLSIIGRLKGHEQTLFCIAVCCKRLHQITIPTLYSRVDLSCVGPRALKSFTAAVLRDPFLANSVRHINTCTPHWATVAAEEEATTDRNCDQGSDITELLLDGLNNLIPDKPRQLWSEDLRNKFPDAILAALLIRLPSLEKLEIGWVGGGNRYVAYAVSRLAGQHDCILPNLTHVWIDSDGTSSELADIIPWLETRALTHLFTQRWCGMWTDWKARQLATRERRGDDGDLGLDPETWLEKYDKGAQPPTSSLVHLELRECILDPRSLRAVIKSCESLQFFVLERSWEPWEEPELLMASELAKSLRTHSKTLRGIRLSCDAESHENSNGLELNPIDFSAFSALEELHVDARYLVRDPDRGDQYDAGDPEACILNASKPLRDRLPSSLRVLRLMLHEEGAHLHAVIAAVLELIESRSHVPRLRLLRIDAPFKTKTGTLVDTTELQIAARQAGITLVRMDLDFEHEETEDDEEEEYEGNWGITGTSEQWAYQAWEPFGVQLPDHI